VLVLAQKGQRLELCLVLGLHTAVYRWTAAQTEHNIGSYLSYSFVLKILVYLFY